MDLTLDDVLDVTYPGAPSWSADGAFLAYTVHEKAEQTLYLADAREDDPQPDALDLSGGVSAFAWAPEPAPGRIAVVTTDGELLLHNAHTDTTELLGGDVAGDDLAWDEAGDRLAAYRNDRPCVFDLADGGDRVVDAPERGRFLGEGSMLAFDGDRLAFRFEDNGSKGVGVVDLGVGEGADPADTRLLWRTNEPASCHSPAWLGDGRLLFDRNDANGTVREIVAVDPDGGDRAVLVRETDDRGTVSRGRPTVSPTGDRLAMALPFDGYDHVHVVDAESGDRRQITEGSFEDKGDASARPRWLDDDTLVFASNREDLGWRGIFAVSADGGEAVPLVTTPGTNVHPRPSPDGERLAYVHAGRDVATEIRVVELAEVTGDTTGGVGLGRADDASPDDAGTRFTRSAVAAWPVDPVDPELVRAEGPDGVTVRSYLLDPRETGAVDDDATDLPLVVWVHGGPMRQMRDGWHPGRSYGLAYSAMQYFAQQGYVGLMVNYRGGIGYGREFRQALAGSRGREEMDDIVAATAAAQDLPYVADDRAGIWGLSYGGYATLQLLGTHPGVFDVSVNLAGLADLELYRDWAEETKYPAIASAQTVRLGGEPWEAPDAWAEASPVTHFENYEAPLYSYHGTGDRYVNVAQQDLVVDELVGSDVEFHFEYYPDENHVFGDRAVWERVLGGIEDAFDEHLR